MLVFLSPSPFWCFLEERRPTCYKRPGGRGSSTRGACVCGSFTFPRAFEEMSRVFCGCLAGRPGWKCLFQTENNSQMRSDQIGETNEKKEGLHHAEPTCFYPTYVTASFSWNLTLPLVIIKQPTAYPPCSSPSPSVRGRCQRQTDRNANNPNPARFGSFFSTRARFPARRRRWWPRLRTTCPSRWRKGATEDRWCCPCRTLRENWRRRGSCSPGW